MVKSRVVIAVAPDVALRRTLRAAMIAAGAEVRVVAGPDELGDEGGLLAAELLAYHVAGDADVAAMAGLAGRLPEGGKVMALLPRGDLAASVEAMRAHPRVASVVSVDPRRPAELTQVAARLLDGDVFGLEKVLPWGVRIHSLLVGDYREKAAAVSSIAAFAAAIGLRRYHRERIERCSDEMMMNAIYDAPPDGDAAPLPRARAREVEATGLAARAWSPRLDEGEAQPAWGPADRAVVEFGCDGQRFAIAVRDSYGRFRRDALVESLHRCLRAAEPVQSRSGGAGLGLYLLSRSSSALLFNLMPGAATECICVFDLEEPRIEIDQIGVYQEQLDEDDRLARRSDRVGHPALRRRSAAEAPIARPAWTEAPRSPAGLVALCALGFTLAVGMPHLSMARLRRAVLETVSWARGRDSIPTTGSCELRPSLSRTQLPVGTR